MHKHLTPLSGAYFRCVASSCLLQKADNHNRKNCFKIRFYVLLVFDSPPADIKCKHLDFYEFLLNVVNLNVPYVFGVFEESDQEKHLVIVTVALMKSNECCYAVRNVYRKH